MTLYGTQKLQAGETLNMVIVGAVTQTPENTRIKYQGETATTAPTAAGTVPATMSLKIPPVYQAKQYGGNLPAPRGAVTTAMSKITPETQIKNERDIFNLLNTQGSELRYLNGYDTLFTTLLAVLGTHQVKIVYVMGIGRERIGQTSSIANKLHMIYGEGVPNIGPSQTLVLDVTVKDKLLVKNPTPEYVQPVFANGHAVDQQLESASNVTNEEEIMKIAPILS